MKISVIITSYNQKAYLDKTIQSALSQTLAPYEIIIADDASSDGSVELIKNYQKNFPRIIRPVFNKLNAGVSRNRNSGFKAASGDLVTWANGDDILLRHKLQYELKTYLNNPDARWVYSQVHYVDALGKRLGVLRYNGKFATTVYGLTDVITQIGKEPAYQLIDRRILPEIGLFDEKLAIYEDWDFTIRLASRYRAAYCPTPLYEYRQHGKGLSSAGNQVRLESFQQVARNIKPLLTQLPVNQAKRIQKLFESECFGMRALIELENANRPLACKHLLKALSVNPFNSYLYQIAMLAAFPVKIINALKLIKLRYFKNIR